MILCFLSGQILSYCNSITEDMKWLRQDFAVADVVVSLVSPVSDWVLLVRDQQ